MKGIIYTRVSSEEQVKGTSLEFQEELCRTYCQQKEIEVVAVFREEGETAKNLSLNNRRQFLAALEYCRKYKKQIDAFVVLRVDRFARNTEDHFSIRKILADYGTTLHSVTEPIGNKPAEKFIETVLAGAAEYENAIRKQRCTDGMLSRINQGIYPWKSPIGYSCLHTKKKGEKKTRPDPPDEKTFPIIQRALKEYATGNYTQVQITRMLDMWGLRTTRGKRVSPQLVDKLLGDYLLFYAGVIYNPWTEEEVTGAHIPMITKDEMYQIQFIRTGKSPKMKIKHERLNLNFPLRRTIRCSSCLQYLTASIAKGKSGGHYFYYHCYSKTCSMYGKGISKKQVESDFLNLLTQVTPNIEFLNTFKNVILDVWKEGIQLCSESVIVLEKHISNLEAKKKRIFEMREEGDYSKEEFVERKRSIEHEIISTKMSLKEMSVQDVGVTDIIPYMLDFIVHIAKEWTQFPVRFQAGFQKLIFPEGIMYNKGSGFQTPKLGIIYSLNEHFNEEKSYLVNQTRFYWKPLLQEITGYHELLKEMEAEKQYSEVA